MHNPMDSRKKMLHEVIAIARKAKAKKLKDKFMVPPPVKGEMVGVDPEHPDMLTAEANMPEAAPGALLDEEKDGFPAAQKLAALLKHLGG